MAMIFLVRITNPQKRKKPQQWLFLFEKNLQILEKRLTITRISCII